MRAKFPPKVKAGAWSGPLHRYDELIETARWRNFLNPEKWIPYRTLRPKREEWEGHHAPNGILTASILEILNTNHKRRLP